MSTQDTIAFCQRQAELLQARQRSECVEFVRKEFGFSAQLAAQFTDRVIFNTTPVIDQNLDDLYAEIMRSPKIQGIAKGWYRDFPILGTVQLGFEDPTVVIPVDEETDRENTMTQLGKFLTAASDAVQKTPGVHSYTVTIRDVTYTVKLDDAGRFQLSTESKSIPFSNSAGIALYFITNHAIF